MHHTGKDLADKYDSKLATLLDEHAPLTVKEVRVRKKVAWFDKTAREMKKSLDFLKGDGKNLVLCVILKPLNPKRNCIGDISGKIEFFISEMPFFKPKEIASSSTL